MSGSGSAGSVDFPAHMKNPHQDWIGQKSGADVDNAVTVSLYDVMETALAAGGNPYEGLEYNDPSTDFDSVETEYNTFQTSVSNLDNETDYVSTVDAVVAKIDEAGIINDIAYGTSATDSTSVADTQIAAAVSKAVDLIEGETITRLIRNYETRTNTARDRSVRRFTSSMAEAGAVNSSAYMFGLALIEAQVLQSVEDFHSTVEREQFNRNIDHHVQLFRDDLRHRIEILVRNKMARDSFLDSHTNLVTQSLYQNISLEQASAAVLAEIKRVRTVAEAEYTGNTADLNSAFSSWDFEVYKNSTAVLGGIGGGSFVPKAASKTSSAIGGALSGAGSGALSGAAIGAAGGPIGAGAGALIGAGIGAGSALF